MNPDNETLLPADAAGPKDLRQGMVLRVLREQVAQARDPEHPRAQIARRFLAESAAVLRTAGWMVVEPPQHESSPSLALEYWRPRSTITGIRKTQTLDFARTKTWGEFERDLKGLLRAFPTGEEGVSVAEAAEWINVDPACANPFALERMARAMPRIREAFAVAVQGRSEGYLIEVYGKEWETRTVVPLATVKFLSGWHTVGEAAVRLNEALRDGSCQCEVAPELWGAVDPRPSEITESDEAGPR